MRHCSEQKGSMHSTLIWNISNIAPDPCLIWGPEDSQGIISRGTPCTLKSDNQGRGKMPQPASSAVLLRFGPRPSSMWGSLHKPDSPELRGRDIHHLAWNKPSQVPSANSDVENSNNSPWMSSPGIYLSERLWAWILVPVWKSNLWKKRSENVPTYRLFFKIISNQKLKYNNNLPAGLASSVLPSLYHSISFNAFYAYLPIIFLRSIRSNYSFKTFHNS